ncbi:MAG: GNAT family N-acetyltransferase, partial [Limisphaerales bacterium]
MPTTAKDKGEKHEPSTAERESEQGCLASETSFGINECVPDQLRKVKQSSVGLLQSNGDRVYLRRPKFKDWPEYAALVRKSARLFRGVLSPLRTEIEFAGYLQRCEHDDYLGLLLCRVEDNAIVGTINVSQIVRGNFLNACLGYSI